VETEAHLCVEKMTGKGQTSLATFDENDAKMMIQSPRSLQACKSEGILPAELVFRPIEAFQEKNLSPRLVKLRYDFFEAKRRDLLAATKRAREAIVADEKREKGEEAHQLEILSCLYLAYHQFCELFEKKPGNGKTLVLTKVSTAKTLLMHHRNQPTRRIFYYLRNLLDFQTYSCCKGF